MPSRQTYNPGLSHMLQRLAITTSALVTCGKHMTKHYSPGSSRGSLRAQTPLAPWYGYGIPWSFLLWNLGEPRKLFLIVCSLDFHGVFWTLGEVGGVGLGLCDGVPLLCFGLRTGEPFGLFDDKLALRLKRNIWSVKCLSIIPKLTEPWHVNLILTQCFTMRSTSNKRMVGYLTVSLLPCSNF